MKFLPTEWSKKSKKTGFIKLKLGELKSLVRVTQLLSGQDQEKVPPEPRRRPRLPGPEGAWPHPALPLRVCCGPHLAWPSGFLRAQAAGSGGQCPSLTHLGQPALGLPSPASSPLATPPISLARQLPGDRSRASSGHEKWSCIYWATLGLERCANPLRDVWQEMRGPESWGGNPRGLRARPSADSPQRSASGPQETHGL